MEFFALNSACLCQYTTPEIFNGISSSHIWCAGVIHHSGNTVETGGLQIWQLGTVKESDQDTGGKNTLYTKVHSSGHSPPDTKQTRKKPSSHCEELCNEQEICICEHFERIVVQSCAWSQNMNLDFDEMCDEGEI